jgi:hypothetical protein
MIPLTTISIWAVIKIFVVIGTILFTVFSLVVVRQAKLMTDTLELGFEGFIKLLSYIHLGSALLLLILALTVL